MTHEGAYTVRTFHDSFWKRWKVVSRGSDLVTCVDHAQSLVREGQRAAVFFGRQKVWPAMAWWIGAALAHAEYDEREGRSWACICDPCRVGRHILGNVTAAEMRQKAAAFE